VAAVIAAIGAAFLAGAVALFREHRLQQRRLLVAARAVYSVFNMARIGLETAVSHNEWAAANGVPGEESFARTWEESRGDLAAHLAWEEWVKVERAVQRYLVLRKTSQRRRPAKSAAPIGIVVESLLEGAWTLEPYAEERRSIWDLAKRKLSREEE
jgi:hypothetical protein